jgi:EmrB/QacA subfamily drug resistance transporter
MSQRRPIVLVTALAYFMVALDALVVVTALPSIHRDLGGSPGALQWTVSAYTLTFAAGIITASALGDRFGRRRVYRSGLALFTAASVTCAVVPDLDMLVASRAVQGAGAAIVMPLGLTLLTAAFPADRRGAAVGIWGGIAGLGVAGGPVVGGAITEGLDWHWVFWVNVPLGLVLWLAAGRVLVESHGPVGRLDPVGMLLAATGAAGLVWGLVQAPELGWTAGRTLAGLGGGVLLLAGFLAWQTKASAPMIPPSLFRSRTFTIAVCTGFLMSASIFSAAFMTSAFFQLARGNTPLGTGLRFLPWTATPLLVAPLAGRLADRVGARRLLVPGLLVQALGFVVITRLALHDAGYVWYVVPFAVAGIGISMALPSAPAAALGSVGPESLGRASGVVNTLSQLGASVGVALVTIAFDANGGFDTPRLVASGYRSALPLSAALSVAGALVALGLRRPTIPEAAAQRPPRATAPEWSGASN